MSLNSAFQSWHYVNNNLKPKKLTEQRSLPFRLPGLWFLSVTVFVKYFQTLSFQNHCSIYIFVQNVLVTMNMKKLYMLCSIYKKTTSFRDLKNEMKHFCLKENVQLLVVIWKTVESSFVWLLFKSVVSIASKKNRLMNLFL